MSPFDDLLAQAHAALRTVDGVTTASWGDITLSSHFQPIFSLSHGRVVGHEALMRARHEDGTPLSPPEVFAHCADRQALGACDRLSRLVHVHNIDPGRLRDHWLFLNVHSTVLSDSVSGDFADTLAAYSAYGWTRPEQVVLEILEGAIHSDDRLDEAVRRIKQAGFLVAIDDFGAGHSNFERVWRLNPDIVKLDRTLTTRSTQSPRNQRMIAQMVSLLHECGALVLMEGVETEEEALVAFDSDVDLVQGYYFGRPAAQPVPHGHAPDALKRLYGDFQAFHRDKSRAYRESVAPYLNGLGYAASLLSAGRGMNEACQSFLDLPCADMCYLLDADGRQFGEVVRSQRASGIDAPAYAPLRDADGASWSRRKYFRDALASPGRVHISQPYRATQGHRMCVTVSSCFNTCANGTSQTQVICGDFLTDDDLTHVGY
ncbi:EAL domain-containing protein [Aquabacterium sp.]|uniref:sensor domain-containing phosphodiesterase n=1 Tax=Aquabacterium sp. TaxID=1872578 RepID=UPI0035B2E0CB